MILGIDTETVRGYARMISDGQRVEKINNFSDVVSFMKPLFGKTLFAWHMDFDAQAILKYLPMEKLQELYADNTIYTDDDVKVVYFPGKFLCIGKKYIYDLCQFYGGSLKKAAIEYLEEKYRKIEHPIVEDFKTPLYNTDEYLNDNWNLIADYCRNDSYLVELLGYKISNVFENEGISFRRPMSQAAVAQNYILDRRIFYPKNLGRIGRERDNAAIHLSFHGGWFETWQRGIFHDVYDYDIVSAYPSVMQHLPHWYDGWVHVIAEEDEDKLLKSSIQYGWVLAEFDYAYVPYRSKFNNTIFEKLDNEEYILTFPSRRIFFPSGKRRQVITLDEYRYLKAEGRVSSFMGGYAWIPNRTIRHSSPFEWIPMAFQKKSEYKDFRRMAWKILMNSAYGKTAQVGGKLEDFRYASYITARTRLKIMDAIKGYEKSIINIATDGIMSTEPLNLDMGKKLGQWEMKRYKKVVVLGNGMYQKFAYDGKFETRARGITDKRDYDMLADMIAHKDKSAYWHVKDRPCSLGEVLTHVKKLTKEDLNMWKRFERKLDVNADTKRNWDRKYESFSDFFDNPISSKPWTVSEVENL